MTTQNRPAGLYEPAQPVVIRDPYSQSAQQEEAAQRAARAAERAAAAIDYAPAATERALERYRLALELHREALNRNAHPRPLGARP